MLLKIVLFYILFVNFVNAGCPNGTIVSYSNKNLCYSFQSNKLKFMEAQKICKNLGGNLSSVHNMFENVFLSQEASSAFTESTSSDFWFGANDLIQSGTWAWIDGMIFDFTDWGKGQPQNTTATFYGVLSLQNGKWFSDDCFKEKPFVCSIKSENTVTTQKPITTSMTTLKPKICPQTWTYSNLTKYCYKVSHKEKWANAETLCMIEGAHLASIHSWDEALFVADLATSSSDNSGGNTQTWIGGFTIDNDEHWFWTDGTPFDYVKWGIEQPDGGEECLLLWSGSARFGYFFDYPCFKVLNNYACKMLPS